MVLCVSALKRAQTLFALLCVAFLRSYTPYIHMLSALLYSAVECTDSPSDKN